LNQSPIRKALSILRKHRVRTLLMGGQACILYGAAEFSRDIDLAVLADERNLTRLRSALHELNAQPVFVPALGTAVLLKGHACHFRCAAAGVEGLRIDVMSVLHGCDPFETLWSRRRMLSLPGVGRLHVLALDDLIKAKKTQRDKDWPMVRRLVEADYARRSSRPTRAQIAFWLREARTGEILVELCGRYAATARRLIAVRPALRAVLRGDPAGIERALRTEQERARRLDRKYWEPLRADLARWRSEVRRQKSEV
jgi:hypothetical protein